MSRSNIVVFALIVSLAPVAFADRKTCPKAPKNVREALLCDTPDMEKFVRQSLDMKEIDDDVFIAQSARAYTMALSHPRLTERDAAIRELKGKVDQAFYVPIIKHAAQLLLKKVNVSNIAEQATAMVALTNLVLEAKALKDEDLRGILQQISDADLQISDEANKWAKQPLLGENIVSPSQQAKAALAAL